MAGTVAPNIVTDGLVLYLDAANTKSYPGSGTTWNDIAAGNNGTLINGPTFSAAAGGTIVFDGINDYVGTNSNISFSITEPWSYSIWLSPATDMVNAWKNIIGQNADTNCTWMFHPGGLGFYQNFFNSQTYIWYTSIKPGTTLPVNKFSKITITCSPVDADRTFFKSYLNGIPRDTTTFTWAPINRTQVFNRIGGNGDRHYVGNVATTSIYNKTLSDSEVLQNYNATKTRYGL